MFLAIREIKHSKLRYFLVIGVMFLIAYLVFFLTGLAYGLAQDNRNAVDQWKADNILIAEDANDNLNMSMFPIKTYEEVNAEEKAILAQLPAVVSKKGTKETINAIFFGISPDQFLVPKIETGRMFETKNESVVDDSLRNQYGLQIGDQLKVSGSNTEITIVGFIENAKFNVAPVFYISMETYQEIRFESVNQPEDVSINAIVTKGKVSNLPDNLEKISIATFINNLPGYNAQVLTFGFMIGFLIIIAAIVIGIFIYVLTMQKTDIFGVMKAQGISSNYIARSVISQTFILAFLGVGIGLLAATGTSYLLPAQVPFETNSSFLAAISSLMVLFAILGAFFSVRAVVKIDPLKAIG
ncbi:ABC transporter permease [Enterococcus saccharolyticus]|uniref:Putative hemin transport system permease protein HrtB n=1 Tax=Enterococcus saccharolyticus subsp. saccharolyticus ATCC 43076 TaxID=1139996 RepID=S0J8H4_9ENTE|nr:ABC transporter permease [Enterococcus saccharolyticus]EOT29224.1 efflux ABC transporter permease [Enterococcus saccharolyticus subsp. saccharolyticus ATCC 43076]EOT81023.1 efflux ABC transporter permease [Enterococcus saccharolyticus subsp. saccharolyticus ATCC 43076]OJG85853.1 efflux ABC transporter permease [Enterococcus saccharolyticus]